MKRISSDSLVVNCNITNNDLLTTKCKSISAPTSPQAAATPHKWWSFSSSLNKLTSLNKNNKEKTRINSNNRSKSIPTSPINFSSSVAIQKLRETKWFGQDEERIFCAVIESGFIVEIKTNDDLLNTRNITNLNFDDNLTIDSSPNSIYENQNDEDYFGIVIFKTHKDKKPKPESIDIYTIKRIQINSNNNNNNNNCNNKNTIIKICKKNLLDLWLNKNHKIRINNFCDKDKDPHCEKDIREQITFAQKSSKSMLWHNSQHFAYWCRYGDRQQEVRKRQMSECVKWGNVGMNAGMLLVMNKQKSYSTT